MGRAARGVLWAILLAVLAASGAGLASLAWHPPGSPERAELTSAGDSALGSRLDAATATLEQLATDVEQLADEAKHALEDVASTDPKPLQDSLARGDEVARAIEAQAATLRESLRDLPGDEPDAAFRYSNATLVRRAAVLAAAEATAGLAGSWQTVAARAGDTSRLTGLISQHDETVVDAIQAALNSSFADAVGTLDDALAVMATIVTLRKRLVAGENTVLDQWIERTTTYDRALQHLYATLVASKGEVTVEVQSARRDERAAFDQLPPDRRTILVIISEVTRNGLTQAVIAIDDAQARIDAALATVREAAPGGGPGASPAA